MSKHPITTVVLSSLDRVFPESCPKPQAEQSFSAFKNEPFSFQCAYKFDNTDEKNMPFYITVESELPISVYSVGYVPVLHTDASNFSEKYRPGLFPDMLLSKKTNPKVSEKRNPWNRFNFENGEKVQLYAFNDIWQSLWFTVNENSKNLYAGKYSITIRFFSRKGGVEVGEFSLFLELIDMKLPKQKLFCTNWFYCDCLADTYGVKLFSDRFFEIFYDFVSASAKNGMNMILLPAFTPALDTAEGYERMTVQLVKVSRENGVYSFDFSLMKKYIDICKKAGIKYFEHSHIFTQWGAKAAPKIMVNENGKEKQFFGWQTSACGKKYKDFLNAYLPALKDFLKTEKLEDKIIFHISDEPEEKTADGYRKAKKAVGNLLDGFIVTDALSHYNFYEDGTVETPIVSTHAIDDFIGKCDNLWCYYTGEQATNKLSNRLIINSSERNRMLGIQMYYNGIKGFLHWGYNYYYDVLSHGLFDPKTNPCGYNGLAGTSYLVYPASDGTAIQSVRQKVFFEGINDMRALEAVESLRGRDFTEKLIEKHFGAVTFKTEAESPEHLIKFRQELNSIVSTEMIKKQKADLK